MVFTFVNVHLRLREYCEHTHLTLKKTSGKFPIIFLYTRAIKTGLIMTLVRGVYMLKQTAFNFQWLDRVQV